MATMAPETTPPETFAARLADKILRCRELGHQWRHFTAAYDADARCYDRILKCPSCHTERHQVLDSSGFVVKNSYRYPDGYLAEKVTPGFGREVFRLEAVRRSVGVTERRTG